MEQQGLSASRARSWTAIIVAILVMGGAVACSGGGGDSSAPGGPAADPEATEVDANGPLAALVALRDSSESDFRASADDSGRVRSVSGSFPTAGGTPADAAIEFLARHASVFGLDRPGIDVEVTSIRDHDESIVVRLRQTYRGVDVDPGGLVVTIVGDDVESVSGGGLAPIALEVIPAIGAADATAVAAEDIPGAGVLGVPRLSITKDAQDAFRLVWLVDLASPGGVLAARVDARSGELLGRTDGSLDDLVDKDLEVFDDRGTRSNEIADDLSCVGNGPTAGDEERYHLSVAATPNAHTVWTNTIGVIKWFDASFGWLGFDDDDSPQVEVHADVVMDPAENSIVAAARYINHCEDIVIGVGFHADKRVLAHEYTHGVQDHVGSLDYEGESGAVAEGLANVLGHSFAGTVEDLDSAMDFTDYDDGCSPGVAIEDCPDHGGVHTNDAIVEHFFRAIALGDGGGAIRPAGQAKMARLAFGSMFAIPSDVTISELTYVVENTTLYWAALGRHGFTFDDVCTVTKSVALIMGGPGYCTYFSDHQDDDGDGIPNARDDCDNTNGVDPDGDGIPSVCDDDDDNDGLLDEDDKCPHHWDPTNADNDGDGKGDPCDTNDDGDNHLDSVDNCPLAKNNDQLDSDRDGQGDACDDIDGDGVIDSDDNCPYDWNAGQSNIDGDNLGDACESDADGDGVDDSLDTDGTTDNCQWYPNPDQADADGDGMGDVCDPCPAGADIVTGFTANPFGTGGELPGGLPGGLGDDFIPGTIVSDQDGDGIPDGCDDEAVFLDLGLSGLRRDLPRIPGTGSVTVPGEQPPGGTFDLPDPCPSTDPDDGEVVDSIVGNVSIAGAPVGALASLVDETGRVAGQAPLADGAGSVPFEVRPATGLHLRLDDGEGPLRAGLRADYDFVPCAGEEATIGIVPGAYGGFSELIPREHHRGGSAEGPATSTSVGGPDPSNGETTTSGVDSPTSSSDTTRTTTVDCTTTTTTASDRTTSTTAPRITSTTKPCLSTTSSSTTRPPVVATTKPQFETTTTTRPQVTSSTRPPLSTTTTTRPRVTSTTRLGG
ncbi:thrombospondin type 3 repeat-containing protein [Actinospongicola halichondriae]|uniref:thrombospondin type 3 repeat-containing protein n=1 Tax=Actinospongicola halichondriae TaxID=3236844 RepID=UPI003D4468D2